MKLKFWGTRGGYPTDQSMVSVQLQTPDVNILVDAGSSKIFSDLKLLLSLDAVLLTHIHSDHVLMLPHIILARLKLLGEDYKPNMCPIYSPEDISPIMDLMGLPKHLYSWSNDIPTRIGDVSITYMATRHSRQNFAYRLDGGKSRVIVCTGDTSFFPGLVDFCFEADILICECNYSDANFKEAELWGHMTPKDVASLISRCKAKKTFLYHFSDLPANETLKSVEESLHPSKAFIVAAYDGLEETCNLL